jgi:hypothetical protein
MDRKKLATPFLTTIRMLLSGCYSYDPVTVELMKLTQYTSSIL